MMRRWLLGVRIALAFALALGVAVPLGRRAEAATNGTWDDVVLGTSNSFSGALVSGLALNNHVHFAAVSPSYATDKTLYAVVSKTDAAGSTGAVDGTARNVKVVRSPDGGLSWTTGVQASSFTVAGTDVVTGLAVADNGFVLLMTVSSVAGGTGRVYVSTNRGESFVQYGQNVVDPVTGLGNVAANGPFAIAPNFSASGRVIVGADPGVGGAQASVMLYDQASNRWSDLAFGFTGPSFAPVISSVTNVGTPGGVTYTYRVAATVTGGFATLASAAVSTATGNSPLDGNNKNRITWGAVPGATGYLVYRTASGGTPATTGLIATIASGSTVTVDDTGLAGDGSTPSTLTDRRGVVAVAFSPTYATDRIIYAVGIDAAGQTRLKAVRGIDPVADIWQSLAAARFERGVIRFDRGGYVYFGGSNGTGTGNPLIGDIVRVFPSSRDATSLTFSSGVVNTNFPLIPDNGVGDFAVLSGQGASARIVATTLNLNVRVRWTRTGGVVGGAGAWENADIDITGTGSTGWFVKPVVAAPDGTVFVGTDDRGSNSRGGLFRGKTVDNKLRFTHVGITSAPAVAVGTAVRAVATSPNYAKDTTVFVSTDEGLLRSSNLTGAIASALIGWSTVLPRPDFNADGTPDAAFDKVVFSPTYATDGTLYTFDQDTRNAWVSQDGGDTWQRLNTEPSDGWPGQNAIIKDVAVLDTRGVVALTNDPARPLAVSQDRGETWRTMGLGQGFTVDSTESIAVSGSTWVVSLWTGGQARIYISKDSGSTWSRLGAADMGGLSTVPRLALSPNYAQDGVVLVGLRDTTGGTLGDVYRSIQGGEWQRLNVDQTPDPTNIAQVLPVSRPNASMAYLVTGEAAGNAPRRVIDYLASNVLAPALQFTDNSSDGNPVAASRWQTAHAQIDTLLQGIAVGNDTSPLVLVAIAGGSPSLRRLTDAGASPPTLVSPLDNTASDNIRPTFSWLGTPGMVLASPEYQLHYSKDPSFPSTGSYAVTEVWLTGETTSYAILATTISPGLDKGSTYYWRVRVQNGVWSSTYRFAVLDKPALSQPENGKTETTLRPTLAWSAATGATRYQLQVSKDVRFQADVVDRVFEQPALSWIPTGDLEQGTLYYWRVRAGTSDTWGDWTDPFAFLTPRVAGAPAPTPTPQPTPVGTPAAGGAPASSLPAAVPVLVGLNSIAGKYGVVWTYDAQAQAFSKFDPAAPSFVNTFTELRPGMGLWINVSENTTLTWGRNTYTLYKGLNLIGWQSP
ncbi:MAG: hypothetical protein HY684_05295 [Chloroflexi bacterium]|nr:hypothetical protein [Chloroflexota bacterium]